jgi:hypothetical protein
MSPPPFVIDAPFSWTTGFWMKGGLDVKSLNAMSVARTGSEPAARRTRDRRILFMDYLF